MSTTRTSVRLGGQQRDLGADQRRVLVGLLAGQEGDLHRSGRGELPVELLLERALSSGSQSGSSKSSRPTPGSMLPPVTGLTEPVPHHAAERVHRGVGAHQAVAAVPVDLAVDGCRRWQPTLEPVPHPAAVLGDPDDREPVVTEDELTEVVGLAATARVEDGPVEQHPTVVGIDVDDRGVDLAGVLVGRVERSVTAAVDGSPTQPTALPCASSL
jgi:hypothetical protein